MNKHKQHSIYSLRSRASQFWDKPTSLNMFPHLEKGDTSNSPFYCREFLHGSNVRHYDYYSTRDAGSIPGLGRSSGCGNGNLLQYSCLENSMDRGAWWAAVHGVAKSQKQLNKNIHIHTHTPNTTNMTARNQDGDFSIAFALLSFNNYPSILPISYSLLLIFLISEK